MSAVMKCWLFALATVIAFQFSQIDIADAQELSMHQTSIPACQNRGLQFISGDANVLQRNSPQHIAQHLTLPHSWRAALNGDLLSITHNRSSDFLDAVSTRLREKLVDATMPVDQALFCFAPLAARKDAATFYRSMGLIGPMFSNSLDGALSIVERFKRLSQNSHCGEIKDALTRTMSERLPIMRRAALIQNLEIITNTTGHGSPYQVRLEMPSKPSRAISLQVLGGEFPPIPHPEPCRSDSKAQQVLQAINGQPSGHRCGEYLRAENQIRAELAQDKSGRTTVYDQLNAIRDKYKTIYFETSTQLPLLLYMQDTSVTDDSIARALSNYLRHAQVLYSKDYSAEELASLTTDIDGVGGFSPGADVANQLLIEHPEYCGVAQTWINDVTNAREANKKIEQGVGGAVFLSCALAFKNAIPCTMAAGSVAAFTAVSQVNAVKEMISHVPYTIRPAQANNANTAALSELYAATASADKEIATTAAIALIFKAAAAAEVKAAVSAAKQGAGVSVSASAPFSKSARAARNLTAINTPLALLNPAHTSQPLSVCDVGNPSDRLLDLASRLTAGRLELADYDGCLKNIYDRFGFLLDRPVAQSYKLENQFGTLSKPIREAHLTAHLLNNFMMRDLFLRFISEAESALHGANSETVATAAQESFSHVMLEHFHSEEERDLIALEAKEVVDPTSASDVNVQPTAPCYAKCFAAAINRIKVETFALKIRDSVSHRELLNEILYRPDTGGERVQRLRDYFIETIGTSPNDDYLLQLVHRPEIQIKPRFDYEDLTIELLKAARAINKEALKSDRGSLL